jgi:hypothetical protein
MISGSAGLSLKNPVLNRKRTINSPAKSAAGTHNFDFFFNAILSTRYNCLVKKAYWSPGELAQRLKGFGCQVSGGLNPVSET